jgi:hypothetical protein
MCSLATNTPVSLGIGKDVDVWAQEMLDGLFSRDA